MENKTFTVKQLSELTNLSPSKIRYYDRQGILPPAEVRENGYRYYNTTSLDTIAAIKSYQRHGATIAEIRELLYGNKPYFVKMGNFCKKAVKQAEKEIIKLQKQRDEFIATSLNLERLQKEYEEGGYFFYSDITFSVFIPDQHFVVKPYVYPVFGSKFYQLDTLYHSLDANWFAHNIGTQFEVDIHGTLEEATAKLCFHQEIADTKLVSKSVTYRNVPCICKTVDMTEANCLSHLYDALQYARKIFPDFSAKRVYLWVCKEGKSGSPSVCQICVPLRETV